MIDHNSRIVQIRKILKTNESADCAVICDWGGGLCATYLPRGYDLGMLGVFLPVGGKLSEAFYNYNHLTYPYRIILDAMTKDLEVIPFTAALQETDEVFETDGIFLPLSCLYCTKADLSALSVGDIVNEVDGLTIYEVAK